MLFNSARKGLAGRVAIVTGAASGIGKALSEELARRGCEVVLADRQIERAAEVASGIRAAGAKATEAELDVRDLAAFKRVANDTKARAGRIDYLFNNAGIVVGGELEANTAEDWDDVIDVNLRGVAYGVLAVYPLMVAQGHGHIVNTASVAGLIATPGEASYVATKHAVVGLTKALRIEARPHGVRATALCPGAVQTPILMGGHFGRINIAGVDTARLQATWDRLRPLAPAELARRAIDGVLRNEAIIIEPRWWRLFWHLDRVSPRLSMRVWGVIMGRMLADLRAASAKP